MRIILKHLLKNIFGKPGRTFLVVTCITICSFIALFTFDLTSSMRNILGGAMGQLIGTADIMVNSSDDVDLENLDLPEYESVTIYETMNEKFEHSKNAYYMVDRYAVLIESFDIEKASRMGFGNGTTNVNNGECLVSEEYQEKYAINVGDTITLLDTKDAPHEFKVVGTAYDLSKILATEKTVIVSYDDIQMLSGGIPSILTLIDVKDDAKAKEVETILKEQYPRYDVEYFLGDEDMEEEFDQMNKVFSLVLAICILMVIFVTISVSERIICERMAVVGTLRSLGFSRNATTAILLGENGLYGLIGSLIGIGIYAVVRLLLLSSLFNIDFNAGTGMEIEVTYGSMNYFVAFVVIVAAIVIECLCSLKEVLKAVKTPIRDIIFSNKDAKYELSKISVFIGIAFMLISLALMFFAKTLFAAQIISIILMMAGVSMVCPCFFVFIGKNISNFFEKNGKIIPALAARESFTKKNTIGASVLITTVVALCVVVISYSASLISEHAAEPKFSSDIEFTVMGEKVSTLNYIEHLDGVTDVMYTYNTGDTIAVNEETSGCTIYSATGDEDGLKYNAELASVPGIIGENELYVSNTFARKLNLEVGDIYEFTFCSDEVLPFVREMTVVGIYKQDIKSMVINRDFYENVYSNRFVDTLYVCCDNPAEVDAFIEQHSDGICYTRQEQIEMNDEDSAQVMILINTILVIGCLITFIGASGSLLIGFEARKRECAVLLSTSLTKGKLCLSFFLESFFASFWGIIFALPFGLLMTIPVKNVFEVVLDEYMEMTYDIPRTLGILLIMLLAFSLMSIQPINALRKMKLAEQLKYE
ncbi:MAG: ABC transporter permease [Clostridia bacterium]|nr:ABC transporter permease [Clostridia bacterium]